MTNTRIDKVEIVQQYQAETLKIQEKAKDIEKKSEQEKTAFVAEVDNLLLNLKKDAAILTAQNDTVEQAKLLGFQTELENIKPLMMTENVRGQAVIEEESDFSADEEKNLWEKTKDWTKEQTDAVLSPEVWKDEPVKNSLRVVAGVGTVVGA